MSFTVLITDSNYPDTSIECDVVSAIDAEVVLEDATTPDELVRTTADPDALLNQSVPITRTVLEVFSDLQIVSRYGVGVDNVDIEAATERGIMVANVPSYCEGEVATHALALMLAVVRRVVPYDRSVKDGSWDWKTGRPIPRLVGGTIGFVGFGKIPETLAGRLAGWDLNLVAFDPYRSAAELNEHDVEKAPFHTVLEQSDVISIHAPLTDETDGLFDTAAFGAMKENAVVVNTARGEIVEEEALYDAIDGGEIAGAGLDVTPEEPPDDSPLFDLEKVVLTPHVAWYSEESMVDLRRRAAENVVLGLRGENPDGLVNDAALDR